MSFPPAGYLYDCSCSGGIIYGVSQCRSCGCSFTCDSSGCGPSTCSGPNLIDITQKRIWNTVRVPASEYVMNLGSLTVYQQPSSSYANVNWNQYSDRALPGNSMVSNITIVPSHGNSTKSSITRLRPGSLKPGGKGVDIKHGSYDRYLARLKGKGLLRTQTVTTTPALYGAKIKAYGIVGSSNRAGGCLCFS
jgi:hypothetical protein